MAVTVEGKNYTLINACGAATDWTDGVPGDVTDFFKEGTQCVGFELWSSGDNDHYITGTWDLSGVKHLRFWFMTTVLSELNTAALGGIQVYVSDGANTGYYYIGGNDTYAGGWYNMVFDLSQDVDSGTKPTMSSITTIGIRCNLTAGAKKTQSMWIDHVCVCDGLVAYGEKDGGFFDLDDIYEFESDPTSGAYGVIRKISGQYFSTGSIEIGDSAGSSATKFQTKSSVVVYEDRPVNADLYNISVVDNGTNTTDFMIGNLSGTDPIEGCVLRVAELGQAARFDILGNNENVDNFGLYGSTILGSKNTEFPRDTANVEVLNCNFETCSEILPSSADVTNCNIISASGAGMQLSHDHNVTYTKFISCERGVNIPASGAYTFIGLEFSGNTYDVENSAPNAVEGYDVTVTNTYGSDASTHINTAGGTTYIQTLVTHKLTGLIENTEVVYVDANTDDELYHVENVDAGGETSYQYNWTPDFDVKIYIHHLEYNWMSIELTLGNSNASVPIKQISDRWYDNPA